MTIIKIDPLENGAHDNQTIDGFTPDTFPVPEGWACLPEELGTPNTLENYPFGELAVADVEGVPTVTGWTPGELPPSAPEPEPVYTDADMIAALLG